MSFSAEVKKELFEHTSPSVHCRRAELAAILSMEAVISANGEKREIIIKSENKYAVYKSVKLMKLLFGFAPEIETKAGTGKSNIYKVTIADEEKVNNMFSALKLRESDGVLSVDNMLIERVCCKRAFLRGCFIATGSVNNPEKAYHLEIVCGTEEQALQLIELMKSFEISARHVLRKKYHIVYIKDGSVIVDVLNVMEAHVSLMNMENVRILKDMRNKVNRQVNCETANINKTVNAAVKQIEDIKYIERVKGLNILPPALRQTALLRLEEPELSLKDLGAKLNPPVGKSGVNHRLKKISEISDKLREMEI